MIPYQCNRQDGFWISSQIKQFPFRFRPHLAKRYSRDYVATDRRTANLKLLELTEKLKLDHIKMPLVSDDDAIVSKAKRVSGRCSIITAGQGFDAVIDYAGQHINKEYLPQIDKSDESYISKMTLRLTDHLWWRRALRKQQGRAIEGLGRNINLVNVNDGIYCTDETVSRRQGQKSRNRAMLEEVQAINELGQKYTLAELSDLSVSNPSIRRGELMTRIAGFEAYAEKKGHVGEFWTVTLPSKYHASLSKTGEFNPKYGGIDPRQGQKKLANLWSRVRAKLNREKIAVYGFRVTEPQHDGTPHWHLLLFMPESVRSRAQDIMRHYALLEDGAEPGAKKYRFESVKMNKGGAAGYIAKYISKNIDGYGIESDLFGNDPLLAANRVDAWASTWGIRQFQQIGGHSVTVWRELRRMEDAQIDNRVKRHYEAADSGDWCEYLLAMDEDPLDLAKVWDDRMGRYEEPIGYKVYGVGYGSELIYITRLHEWTISSGKDADCWPGSDKSLNEISGWIQEEGKRQRAAWSTVNNCTEVKVRNARKEEAIPI